jgi:hypothetical protein
MDGQQLPVGKLLAPLTEGTFGIGVAPNALTLANPAVAVCIGTPDADTSIQEIDFLVEADFNKTLRFSVGIPVTGGTLAICTAPLDNQGSINSLIESLPGGHGFASYIPQELSSIFANVGLDGFTMIVDATPKVSFLSLAIGTIQPWPVIADALVLKGLSLRIEVVDPAGLNWMRIFIDAKGKFLPKIFEGEFDFIVGLEEQTAWEVSSISGGYYGSVSLADLVGGLLGSHGSVPEALRAIRFSDFGLTATRSGPGAPFTYGLYGSTEAAFPIASSELTAQLSVTVTKTPSSYDIHLGGVILIGEQPFIIMLDLASRGASLAATWTSTDGSTLGFADISKALGIDAPVNIPAGLDLGLKSASFTYDATNQAFTLSAESAQFGDAFFVTARDQNGKLGFVFGVDTPHAGHLSSLPGIGGDLKAADFLTFEQVSFLVSSGTFQNFVIPALPALPVASAQPAGQASAPGGGGKAGRAITPLAGGASLQLVPGLSLAAGMTFATASADRRMSNLAAMVGQPRLLLQATIGKDLLRFFCALTGTIWIPAGGRNRLALSNPGVEIDITGVPPVMAVQLAGGVSFNAPGLPIAAAARMTISETEAQVACTIAAGQPAASQIKVPGLGALPVGGLGVEMGVFFEPPGVDLGVQGNLTIGQGAAEQTRAFAVVMEMVEEVPNPLYLSYYIDKLTLGSVLAMNMPYLTTAAAAGTKALAPGIYEQAQRVLEMVEATDLSFHWCDSVVILPDGTVAQPGFGFSGAIRILGWSGFAELEMGAAQGLGGTGEMSRLNLHDVLVIEGDGKGIRRNTPSTGGATPNNTIVRGRPVPAAQGTWVVPPGGPVFTFNAAGAPFLKANFKASLFAERVAVDVTVSATGFSFVMSYQAGGVAKFDMRCILTGPEHFSAGGELALRVDGKIGPIRVKGVDVGSLILPAVDVTTELSILLDPSSFSMSLSGHFQFEGVSLTVPKIAVNVAPKSVGELPGLMFKIIQDHADQIFLPLLRNVEKWANLVGRGVVTGVTDVGSALQRAYGVGAQDGARLMKEAGRGVDEIGRALRTGWHVNANDAAKALKGAGFGVNEVGNCLKTTFSLGPKDLEAALHGVGFSDHKIKGLFHSLGGDFAKTFGNVGHEAKDAGRKIKGALKKADPRHWHL